MPDPVDQVKQSLQHLLETYNELNSSHIDELDDEPSALEFYRYVAQNRPFVARGGCSSWSAMRKWNAEYLDSVVGGKDVNVAITPLGNADAVVEMPDGSLTFVKPLERMEKFKDVLQFISSQELTDEPKKPIKYAQTQNDNLRGEYAELLKDVPHEIPFARIALQKDPDAINFWLGNSRSVTAMHKDNYENIYAQIRGKKHFVLLPPVAAPCVNEQEVPGATYTPEPSDTDSNLQIQLDQPAEMVPVPTWDPEKPDERATAYSRHAEPVHVTLNEGDLLYLPALWFHKVKQSCGDEHFCCAVNYWYDMEFGGSFWSTHTFIREVGNAIIHDGGPKTLSAG